jgi:hypothetical protein
MKKYTDKDIARGCEEANSRTYWVGQGSSMRANIAAALAEMRAEGRNEVLEEISKLIDSYCD